MLPKGVIEDRRVPRRMVRLFATSAVALVALVVLALLWPKKPSAASRALDAKLAQLRAEGVPLTAAEIAKVLPDPDPAHDARSLLREAFAVPRGPVQGPFPVMGGATMPGRAERFSESEMQAMALYLSNSDKTLAAIPHRLEGVGFSRGWTNGLANVLPSLLIDVRNLEQLLAVKAIYEAERGNSARAAEALRKGFAVAGVFASDTLVDAMMRYVCGALMSEATERTLNRVQLADTELAEIQHAINVEQLDNFDDTFRVEGHLGWLVFDEARRGLDYFDNRPLRLLLWKLDQLFSGQTKKFYRDEDYLLFLNLTDERRKIHHLPGLERIRRHEQLDLDYTTKIHSLTAESVMPHWGGAMRTATEIKARLVALKTALAIERYRLAHSGGLPDTLDSLVPEYLASGPGDPMDEKPLRFRKLARGYVVYSIGADGLDNGGAERAGSTNIYDITITIER